MLQDLLVNCSRIASKNRTCLAITLLLTLSVSPSYATQNTNQIINITYLKLQRDEFPGVPTYLASPENEGISGAQSALDDANKTGKFLGYQLQLDVIRVSDLAKLDKTQQTTIQSSHAVIIDSDPPFFDSLLQTLMAKQVRPLIINVRNHDNALRSKYCEAPILHVAPSYQMKTDALGQWFRTKRIEDIAMLTGPNMEDSLFAKAFEKTAKQFKLSIVENKAWQFSFDLRRSAFNEIPAFTRSGDKYEAIFVADHAQQFAYSLPYNTYYQVPISGSAGLQALGWHSTHEQWGARQLQGRFAEKFKRVMTEYDYFSYVAVTAVSTAVQASRTHSDKSFYQLLLSEKTSIAAYKGRQLSFAKSTRQLRQPLILAHAGALVTSAPLPGFLHQTNDLDTLGASVTGCKEN